MNRKISRNEKHKYYSNEEKLALAQINIIQENDNNILKLLQNL